MNIIDLTKDVCSITDVGLVRKVNEDNCFHLETINGYLFVVCDGIGGHVGGATASSIAVTSMVNFFSKEKYSNLKEALTDAIVFSNREILNVVAEKPELKGMGTTICVALINDDKVWFAHVGDSRIYLYNNQMQQLHRLTKDHSVVQALVDKGEITDAEAETHPQRNRILKALGIKNEIHPDVCNMPLLPANGDIILLCTDGLTSMVSDNVLQHVLKQDLPLQEKGKRLRHLANEAGGNDNITLQLMKISNCPHKQSVFESKNDTSCEQNVIENDNSENVKFEKKNRRKLRNLILLTGIILLALGALIIIKYFV
jgi:serine/threonine protein phosphatase PrpC